ncbi:neurochondrin isoform X1 [Cucumis melo var. makuwa]|uniref:Neurochondrin isoform X1 n=1 Tax=Cucumis melo var. makuwa TaxID=1194695 RepID=A0A5D3C3W9_CUCMM|nr:neurochondrin isoform X1 [Cucumis melo var. makuwa]
MDVPPRTDVHVHADAPPTYILHDCNVKEGRYEERSRSICLTPTNCLLFVLLLGSLVSYCVVKCLINLIHKHGGWIDNDGSIFLACDTILNASEDIFLRMLLHAVLPTTSLLGSVPLLGKFDFTELFILFESSVICSFAPLLGLQKKCIYKSRFAMHECYTKHGKEVESCLPSYANINNVVKIGSAVGGNYFSS